MQKLKEKKLLKDDVVTKLFTDKTCQDYLLKIISAALGISFDKIKQDFELVDIRINNKKEIKNSQADIVGESKDYIFNLEINYNKSKTNDIKNTSYICQMLLKNIKPGKENKYTDVKKIRQINLNNYDYYKEKQFIYKTVLMEEKTHKVRNDLIEIIDIDIDFLSKFDYNELIKKREDSLEKLLYLFVCDDSEELDRVYVGDKLMEKVREKLDNYTSTLNEVLYYTKADIIDKEVLDEKYREGVEKGIEQEKIEIAKSLIKAGMENDFIKTHVGLTEKEIENIRKSIENN